MGFPGSSGVKNPPDNSGDMGSIPGLGRSPRGGNGNPFQYSCLGNPMDRGAWWSTVHGVAESQTCLSDELRHHNNHQGTVNQNHDEVSPHTCQTAYQEHKSKQVLMKLWRKDNLFILLVEI